MHAELVEKRDRVGSETITAAEELSNSDLASLEFKPTQDPDIPPELSLELEGSENQECFELSTKNKQGMGEAPMKRARTQSEDFQYTILGFLENKIRDRKISQQLESLSVLHECRQ